MPKLLEDRIAHKKLWGPSYLRIFGPPHPPPPPSKMNVSNTAFGATVWGPTQGLGAADK